MSTPTLTLNDGTTISYTVSFEAKGEWTRGEARVEGLTCPRCGETFAHTVRGQWSSTPSRAADSLLAELAGLAEDLNDHYDPDCPECFEAEVAAEARSLSYAENGGGSELANQLRFNRCYDE